MEIEDYFFIKLAWETQAELDKSGGTHQKAYDKISTVAKGGLVGLPIHSGKASKDIDPIFSSAKLYIPQLSSFEQGQWVKFYRRRRYGLEIIDMFIQFNFLKPMFYDSWQHLIVSQDL